MAFVADKHPRDTHGKFVDVIKALTAMGGEFVDGSWVIPAKNAPKLNALLNQLGLNPDGPQINASKIDVGPGKVPLTGSQKKRLLEMHDGDGSFTASNDQQAQPMQYFVTAGLATTEDGKTFTLTDAGHERAVAFQGGQQTTPEDETGVGEGGSKKLALEKAPPGTVLQLPGKGGEPGQTVTVKQEVAGGIGVQAEGEEGVFGPGLKMTVKPEVILSDQTKVLVSADVNAPTPGVPSTEKQAQPNSSDALAAMPPPNAPKKPGGHPLLYGESGLQRNFKAMSLQKLQDVMDHEDDLGGDPAFAVAAHWFDKKSIALTDGQHTGEQIDKGELGQGLKPGDSATFLDMPADTHPDGDVHPAAQDLLSYPELPSFGNSTSLANREDYRKKSAAHEQVASAVERWTGSGVDIELSGDESRQSVRDDIAAGKLDEFVSAAANGPKAPTLFRVMEVSEGKSFEPGVQVKSRGLSAFTEKKEWATNFGGPGQKKVLLEMEGGNGLPVAAISNTPFEAEWLVVNDFEVTEVVSQSNDLVHVKVKPAGIGKITDPVPGPVADVPLEDQAPATLANEDPDGDWPDLGTLKFAGSAGGTTGAKIYVAPGGQKYIWKDGSGQGQTVGSTSPAHLASEMQADALYQAMGVPVADFKAYKQPDGSVVKLAKFVDNDGDLNDYYKSGSPAVEDFKKSLQQHFVVDAWLANWDVIGAGSEQPAGNVILGKDGTVYRIDNGGALDFKGTGGKKGGNAFGPEVNELMAMRDPSKNPSTAKVFGSLTDVQVAEQIHAQMTSGKIEAALAAVKDPVVRDRLEERAGWMVDWADQHGAPAPAAAQGQPFPDGEKLILADGSTATFLGIPGSTPGSWHVQMDGDPEDPSIELTAAELSSAVSGSDIAAAEPSVSSLAFDPGDPVAFGELPIGSLFHTSDESGDVFEWKVSSEGNAELISGPEDGPWEVGAPNAFNPDEQVTFDQAPTVDLDQSFEKAVRDMGIDPKSLGMSDHGLQPGDSIPNLNMLNIGDQYKVTVTGADGNALDAAELEVYGEDDKDLWTKTAGEPDPPPGVIPGKISKSTGVSVESLPAGLGQVFVKKADAGTAPAGLAPIGTTVSDKFGTEWTIQGYPEPGKVTVVGGVSSEPWTGPISAFDDLFSENPITGAPTLSPDAVTESLANPADWAEPGQTLQSLGITTFGEIPDGAVLKGTGGKLYQMQNETFVDVTAGTHGTEVDIDPGMEPNLKMTVAEATGNAEAESYLRELAFPPIPPGAAPAPGTAIGDAPIGSTFQLPNTGGTVFEITDANFGQFPGEIAVKVISTVPSDNPLEYAPGQDIFVQKSSTDAIWTGGPDDFSAPSAPANPLGGEAPVPVPFSDVLDEEFFTSPTDPTQLWQKNGSDTVTNVLPGGNASGFKFGDNTIWPEATAEVQPVPQQEFGSMPVGTQFAHPDTGDVWMKTSKEDIGQNATKVSGPGNIGVGDKSHFFPTGQWPIVKAAAPDNSPAVADPNVPVVGAIWKNPGTGVYVKFTGNTPSGQWTVETGHDLGVVLAGDGTHTTLDKDFEKGDTSLVPVGPEELAAAPNNSLLPKPTPTSKPTKTKFGKNEKQPNNLAPDGGPASLKDLQLEPGDKIQMKAAAGSPILTIDAVLPSGGVQATGGLAKGKHYSKAAKPANVIKADKGPLQLKGGSAAAGAGAQVNGGVFKATDGKFYKPVGIQGANVVIAPSSSTGIPGSGHFTVPVGWTGPGAAGAPGTGASALTKDQVKAKLKPGPAGSTIASIPNGTVVGTPDGKVGVKNDTISTTDGYTAFENVDTGTKFSIKSGFTPQLMSEDTALKQAAADLLKQAKAASAAQSTPAAQQANKALAKAAQKPGAPDKFKNLPAAHIAKQHLEKVQANNSAQMTASEKAATKSYTNGGYNTINEALRSGGHSNATLTTAKKVAALDSAIAKASYNSEPILLSRKTNWDPWKKNAQAGQVIQDNGFLSSSTDEGTWSGNVHLKILAHPGTKGLWANTTGGSSHPSENEYILARGTQFHILKREESGSNTILWVETIP